MHSRRLGVTSVRAGTGIERDRGRHPAGPERDARAGWLGAWRSAERRRRFSAAVEGAQCDRWRRAGRVAPRRARSRERYGAPYATLHRADLQGLLLGAVRESRVHLKLSSQVTATRPVADAVRVRVNGEHEVEGDVLVGADGLWSDGAPPGLRGRSAHGNRAPRLPLTRPAARAAIGPAQPGCHGLAGPAHASGGVSGAAPASGSTWSRSSRAVRLGRRATGTRRPWPPSCMARSARCARR